MGHNYLLLYHRCYIRTTSLPWNIHVARAGTLDLIVMRNGNGGDDGYGKLCCLISAQKIKVGLGLSIYFIDIDRMQYTGPIDKSKRMSVDIC